MLPRRATGREYIVVAGLLVAAAALQGAGMLRFGITSCGPDLVAIVVACWSYLSTGAGGIGWAVLGGLLLDAMSAGPFPHQLLALCMCWLVARGLRTLANPESSSWGLLVVGLAVVAFLAVDSLLLQLKGWEVISGNRFAGVMLPTLLIDTAASLAIMPALRRANRWLQQPSAAL